MDMDGTLLDTLEDIRAVVNSVLSQRGRGTFCLEDYRQGVGSGVEALLRRLLPKADSAEIGELAGAVRESYGAAGSPRTRLYDGVSHLLDAVTAAGIPMAIVTNKPQAAAEQCVKDFLDAWRFGAVIGASPEVPLKPDPTGALQAAEAMGVRPSSAAYLGDSEVDMRTARAAGMLPIGALWGFRNEETLRKEGATHLASNPLDVLRVLIP